MAAEGAVRRTQDGTAWTTSGFLVRVMPNRASLATIADHEDGQFVYLLDEDILVVWDTNRWVDISGAPPITQFDVTVDYRDGQMVVHNDLVYRADGDIANNGPIPPATGSSWVLVGDDHHVYQDSTVMMPPNAMGNWFMHPDLHAIGAITPDGSGLPQFEELLSESIIRGWIAQAGNFRGTVMDTGSAIAGATAVDQIPAADPGNTGTYWVAVEPLDYTDTAGTVVHVNPGDWLMSDGTNYVRVPGGQLTRQLADTLYMPIDERPKVQVLTQAGQTPTTIDPNAPKQTIQLAHNWEVYHGLTAASAQTAWIDQNTGVWQFHRLAAANVDGTADLNSIRIGDTIRAIGENVNTQAMDQIMEMVVQNIAQVGDIWTFTGTLTQTVTLFPAGEYIDGSTCDIEFDVQVPYGHDAKEDDVIINFVEGHTWIYGRDPANPGQFLWHELPSLVTNYIVSTTAGETPIFSGTTQMPTILRPGDRFINEATNEQWIFYEDNAGTGKWRSVSTPEKVLVFTGAGETPTAPPNPLPANLLAGDTIVNTADQTWWLYDGVQWRNMSVASGGRGTVTYVGPGTFDTANVVTPMWGMPMGTMPDPNTLEPEPNDIFVDSTTGDYWVMT